VESATLSPWSALKRNKHYETEFDIPTTRGPVLRVGTYEFYAEVVDDISKAGREMITVILNITEHGTKYQVRDYFGEWNTDRMKQFCLATKRLDVLSTRELKAAMIDGAKGRCVVGIKQAVGQYGETNYVQSYLPTLLPDFEHCPTIMDDPRMLEGL
jgi:hypothetical protein